jgi:two-component system capsular synthesis sensor histidine kinase RcsC
MAPFNPKTLVTTLVNTHHQAAKNKGLTLEQEINYDLDLQLLGDSSKIQQVLFHLINNAIKFTPSGKIVVSLDAAETSNNVVMLKLVVRDTGVGISKQQREHLCKPFYSNSEELQSPGLGLAICARLVRLMGGKLQLNSKLNYGSVFSIKIPLQISDIKLNSPVKEVTNEHIHINTQDFNVLLIDNNEVNHAIIQYGLTNLGYNIHCMKNTSAVFNMLKEERVDIILFDTAKARNMLEQIQEMKDIIGDIPMIAMSDDLELENRANYVQYGITEFITRPISINQVHKTIAQQLQHKTKTQTAQVFEINTFA